MSWLQRNPRVKSRCYLCKKIISIDSPIKTTTGDDGYSIVVCHVKCNFKEFRK